MREIGVLGQRSNQLNYVPTRQINDFAENPMQNLQMPCSAAQNALASPCSWQNRL